MLRVLYSIDYICTINKRIKIDKDMGTEIVIALVGVVCTGLSSWFTFFLTKRKYNTEVESQQIQNMNEAFESYKKTMEANVELLNTKVKLLQEENSDLRSQIASLQKQLTNFIVNRFSDAVVQSNTKVEPLSTAIHE